ncbi:MAG: 16S rRNA (guanine(527)-N(7))-methyltransferase RsmG [Actinobacteria bacterium]|nr:16S rRNA (guanine(527)-N(7))-methyltransferase RsmG [Actinomycetota bacterium]
MTVPDDPRIRAWIDALLSTPGLTAVRDRDEAWRLHVEDSLSGLALVRSFGGPIVDVGSGGGSPGIALASALPDREVTLLEANGRKCAFLETVAASFPNVLVVNARAEEHDVDHYGVAVARALAPPPVTTEWCLPLVAPGGAALLWVGPRAEQEPVRRVAERLGGELAAAPPGFLVLRKVTPTPRGFPRRPGMAKKRPLG